MRTCRPRNHYFPRENEQSDRPAPERHGHHPPTGHLMERSQRLSASLQSLPARGPRSTRPHRRHDRHLLLRNQRRPLRHHERLGSQSHGCSAGGACDENAQQGTQEFHWIRPYQTVLWERGDFGGYYGGYVEVGAFAGEGGRRGDCL